MAAARILLPELFCRARGVEHHCLLHVLQMRDALTEGTRVHYLLLRRRRIFERQAGLAVQLSHGALGDNVKVLPYHADVAVGQLQGRDDAQLVHAHADATPDSPDVADVGELQQLPLPAPVGQVHHAVGLRPLLGRVVGELGQRLARPEAHADDESCFLPDARTHLLPERLQRNQAANPGNVQKALIDGIDFLPRRHLSQYGHHARRHVTVQLVVGAEHVHAVLAEEALVLKQRGGHFNPHPLRLRRTRDDAAVIVGYHDDGAAAQVGPEHGFAGGVKVVGIRKGKHGYSPAGPLNPSPATSVRA